MEAIIYYRLRDLSPTRVHDLMISGNIGSEYYHINVSEMLYNILLQLCLATHLRLKYN